MTTLPELQREFRGGSTNAMPLAGMIVWAGLGLAALWLRPALVGTLALYVMMGILPLATLIDRARGRNLFSGGDDPLTRLFLTSIAGIAVTIPLIVIAARTAGEPTLVVLGMAILAGVIWIPYGWAAADDPVGLRHAVGRALGCYVAYGFAPHGWRASAICAVVVVSYAYALAFMRGTGAAAERGHA